MQSYFNERLRNPHFRFENRSVYRLTYLCILNVRFIVFTYVNR